jgi:hypothetical protein
MPYLAVCGCWGACGRFRVSGVCSGVFSGLQGFLGRIWQTVGAIGIGCIQKRGTGGDLVCTSKKRDLPAVYRFVGLGSALFGHALHGFSFASGSFEVATFVTKPQDDAAVPIIMIKMQFLPWQHQLSTSDTGFAVGGGQ